MWQFVLICSLLLSVTMVAAGRMMWKHCPKEINEIVGYRTRRSKKNKDTWRFANQYCGKLWCKSGIIMLALTVIAFVPFINSSDNIIGTVGIFFCIIQGAVMIACVALTEKALKKTFTDEGIRR